jgi:predicted RNA-binding protein with EMAP domain
LSRISYLQDLCSTKFRIRIADLVVETTHRILEGKKQVGRRGRHLGVNRVDTLQIQNARGFYLTAKNVVMTPDDLSVLCIASIDPGELFYALFINNI